MLQAVPKRANQPEPPPPHQLEFKGYTLNSFQVEAAEAIEAGENVLLAAQPSRRFATVDELGALAVFLCTDPGQSITGTALPVDGGWVAQ